jgi:hypothetical protein
LHHFRHSAKWPQPKRAGGEVSLFQKRWLRHDFGRTGFLPSPRCLAQGQRASSSPLVWRAFAKRTFH